MRVYLVRSATAEGAVDSALSAKGRRRFRRIARAFARLGEPVDQIWTSPALRAIQTAELLAATLAHDMVDVALELRPGGSPEAVLERLAYEGKGGVVLVGHKRQLAEVAARIVGLSGESVYLKKGAIARLDVRGLPLAEESQEQ